MKYVKINNLTDAFGKVDYKGLDINKFIAGSQRYTPDCKICICATEEEGNLPKHVDFLEISEGEYVEYRKEIESVMKAEDPVFQLQEKTDQLENQTAEYMVDLDFRLSNC
ncbi:MAG: hypothetical protein CVU92_02350 [Firmicutes bacterium HGW-Firmicutes-17]|jgi:hypothetical protein|nr:MAG: hypothetical protein CVU92_02350 [Firmicutes bacterium HGW-Firmicutes-17]